MTKYLLTNEVIVPNLWSGFVINPSYSEDLTTKAMVGKSAVCTYWTFISGFTPLFAGDFQDISWTKKGWCLEPERILCNASYDLFYSVYEGFITKIGQRFTVSGKKVSAVRFVIVKTGVPNGNAIVTIRRVSDNSIIAQSVVFDVTQLTGTATWHTFVFTTTPTINEEVRILFEYSGGNVNNCIRFFMLYSDVIDGVFTRSFDTVFTDEPSYDSAIVVYSTSYFNGSFASGDWAFKVRFESDTKYGFRVKVAVRVSKSINVNGSNATLLFLSESPNVIVIPASAGGSVTDSWTYNAPEITITIEYIFVEYRIHIEVAGTNAGAQCSFACDENPVTADESVETTTFTPIPEEGFFALQFLSEPPSAGWNALRYENEPPTPNAWNKLKYVGE